MKVLDIKLHENPSSGSRANACGVIDMAKITGAFRDNANIPKKNKAFFSLTVYLRKLWCGELDYDVLTACKEQSPFLEAGRFSASQ